jgi:hypothetical protein
MKQWLQLGLSGCESCPRQLRATWIALIEVAYLLKHSLQGYHWRQGGQTQ